MTPNPAPDDFIQAVIMNGLLFSYDCLGTQATLIEINPNLGALAYFPSTMAGVPTRQPDDASLALAIANWLTGTELPVGFFIVNRPVAEEVWRRGLRQFGERWNWMNMVMLRAAAQPVLQEIRDVRAKQD